MVCIDLVLDMCDICFSLVLQTGSWKKEILFGNNTTVKGMMRLLFQVNHAYFVIEITDTQKY